MTTKYEIIVENSTDILYRAHGTRESALGTPFLLMEQLGQRWACWTDETVTVTYKNLSEGWRTEKDFR